MIRVSDMFKTRVDSCECMVEKSSWLVQKLGNGSRVLYMLVGLGRNGGSGVSGNGCVGGEY